MKPSESPRKAPCAACVSEVGHVKADCPNCGGTGRCPSGREAPAASAPAGEPTVVVSDIREGEENDGPLRSTDLFFEGRGISLLCNVLAGERFTYAFRVDGKQRETGTVGIFAEPLRARLHALEAERDILRTTCDAHISEIEKGEAALSALCTALEKATSWGDVEEALAVLRMQEPT